MTFLRTPYNYSTDDASLQAGLACEDHTLAQQSFKDESDINTIVNRFGLTGELPTGVRTPTYGDFSSAFDYQTALNAVIAADNSFFSLPATVRARFDHDPAKFVAFCDDDANRDEAAKLGLVPPPVTKVTEPKGDDSPSKHTSST